MESREENLCQSGLPYVYFLIQVAFGSYIGLSVFDQHLPLVLILGLSK
jgi:hypothetical protein